ncbi:hypothetical protein BJX63DRAFT_432820 [Aspergillus granulosus]|uniref:Uncharacterized protein n=1 Tax=Aspergillus granulosus TaxID=176169 RepID=A0ABR4H9W3_9EURO
MLQDNDSTPATEPLVIPPPDEESELPIEQERIGNSKTSNDIFENLKRIESQLADQNRYLAILTEKDTPKLLHQPSPVDDEDRLKAIEESRGRWHLSRVPNNEALGLVWELFDTVLKIFGMRYGVLLSFPHGLSTTRPNESVSRMPIRYARSDLASITAAGAFIAYYTAWPRREESYPIRRWRHEYSTENQCVDFDWFFACCLKLQNWNDEGFFSCCLRRQNWSHERDTPPTADPHPISLLELGYTSQAYPWIGSSSVMTPNARMFKVSTLELEQDEPPWCNRVFGQITALVFGQYTRLLSLRFQVRWMQINDSRQFREENLVGVYLHRDEGDLPNYASDTATDFCVSEARLALAATTTIESNLPRYNMVTMLDGAQVLPEEVKDRFLERNIQGVKAGSYRAGTLMGVGVSLLLNSAMLEWVSEQWITTLDVIDESLDASLAQITRLKRRDLMFDSDQFVKSDQYFAVLQVLHICTGWIKETLRGLEELAREVNESLSAARLESTPPQDQESLRAIFSAVIADCEMRFQPVLDRIERKIEEVKGLRDGSFFGMHLFDPDGSSSASQTPFIITFVILSLTTYLLAACALWFVRDGLSVKEAFSSWRRKQSIRNIL